jgi:hypothetical protein
LNKTDPFPGYHEYLEPHLNKEFLKLRNTLPKLWNHINSILIFLLNVLWLKYLIFRDIFKITLSCFLENLFNKFK